MNARKIAGWALLVLVPLATLTTLAILAGQVPEFLVGSGIAIGLSAAIWLGVKIIDPRGDK